MRLPDTPFFYIGMYILIGVLWMAWRWRGTSSGRVHALARERYGHLADTMLIAPILLWPLSIFFAFFRMFGLVPKAWTLVVKDRFCKCGGRYLTQKTLLENSGVIGKLVVKCEKCRQLSQLWGDVEIEDQNQKPKEGGGA